MPSRFFPESPCCPGWQCPHRPSPVSLWGKERWEQEVLDHGCGPAVSLELGSWAASGTSVNDSSQSDKRSPVTELWCWNTHGLSSIVIPTAHGGPGQPRT